MSDNTSGFDTERAMRLAGGMVGEATVDVPCPRCGVKNSVVLKQVAEGLDIACSSCGQLVHLQDSSGELRRFIRGE